MHCCLSDRHFVVSDSDAWSKFAPSFVKLATDNGPAVLPAQDMIKAGDAAYPFSSALTVLDIGCGTGQVMSEVLKAHGSELPSSSRLVASDLSPGMIEQVQIRKAAEIEKGNTSWSKAETVVCNATDLSKFPDSSVSHALAGFVLFMVPQPRTALKEIQRVLTNQNGGGFFALSSWLGSEWLDLMSFSNKVRPDKPILQMLPPWNTIEGVRGELEATGFRDIDVHLVETFWPFDDYDEIARYILTQFPGMSKMTADMSREELENVRDLMVKHIIAKHPSVPGRLTGTAIIGLGRK